MLFGRTMLKSSITRAPSCLILKSPERLLCHRMRLSFETHVRQLCAKAIQKQYASAKLTPFIDSKMLITLSNAFTHSQFSCCPLVWVFHSSKAGHKINIIHERAYTHSLLGEQLHGFSALRRKIQSGHRVGVEP